tara:strand:- start:536 stop:1621 length:1086 start_codon:yes stop_codon:yes gene_type:complete
MKKNSYLSLGIMSGTSNDGIDISLIQSDGKNEFRILGSKYIKYNGGLTKELNDITNNISKLSLFSSRIIKLQDRITKSYINGIKRFKMSNKSKIDLISLHGQTIFHDPHKKISIQLCNSELIKSEFNCRVVYDFRQNDIKYGGEGAPLTPIFHKLINSNFSLSGTNAYLNIGGVSNVTIINKNEIISAFDTGPGMAILNDYVFYKRKKFFDKNGEDSSKGQINKKLINSLMKDNFFKRVPPKSLDKNYFNKSKFLKLPYYDACSSIVEFTVESIKKGLIHNNFRIDNLILMGGGVKNKQLMRRIKDKIKVNIVKIGDLGISEDFIEAQAFAYLGIRSLKKLPITYPQTTGVTKAMIGGKII